ncbi:MAG TPA: hypothetical protein VNU71_13365 [Burkholderiaceae bacterium]|nr:hypothetical protein [Burkholderiaceae bacterium]
MKRESMVRMLAPPAPRCFDDRLTWLSFCESAALEQRTDYHPGPLLFKRGVIEIHNAVDTAAPRDPRTPPLLVEKGRVVQFNPEFDFCAECTPAWRAQMVKAKRCEPTYLRDLLTEKEPAS